VIVALDGILENRSIDSIVIKVGLISFQVNVPNSTAGRLGTTGDKVHLYTYLYLREDNIALYGFTSQEELGFFKNLISVSGIGPRAALALLSAFSTEQLISAISNNNVDLISQVPGIGKKTAGHVVLELKGKLTKGVVETIMPELQKQDADVVAALTSLGYSLKEATQAVSSLPLSNDIDLAERVRLALQQLAAK
jgi:Holliday junction DNA helicase RuvA